MKLELRRDPFSPKGTTGQLSVDGQVFCFTLEPPKEPQVTDGPVCIPAGVYAVKVEFSPRFQRPMPRVLDVPGREGILIHWGNYVENTDGCILVGSSKSLIQGATQEPAVWDSRETFDKLFREIEEVPVGGIVITVRDAGSMPGAHEHPLRTPIFAKLKES